MRRFWEFITSPLLCVACGIGFFLSGLFLSLFLDGAPGYFEDIESSLLLTWLRGKVAAGFSLPLIFFLLFLLVVAVFTLNLVLCTGDHLTGLVRRRSGLRRFIPHIMHVAVVLVVAGHAVSASSGARVKGVGVLEGRGVRLFAPAWTLYLEDVDIEVGKWGYPADMVAHVKIQAEGVTVARGSTRPNEPFFVDGYVLYLKNAGVLPSGARYALFDLTRDPGAPVVLIGALLFTLGNLLYLLFPARNFRKNERRGK
ncbi:MAG: hypothetical protein D6713_02385 [Deltaproteobacteria bacterium]|nr:MAG: hypothetical protein D6713_02385 [Deltaproteobacteria bacterium]